MRVCSLALVGVLVVFSAILSACSVTEDLTENESTWKEEDFHAFDVDYEENADGTYSCRGYEFKYKLDVSGKEGGKLSRFSVLTNKEDLLFVDVSGSLKNNTSQTGMPEFIILGYYA